MRERANQYRKVLEISIRTVQRWMHAGAIPERTVRRYSHSVDVFVTHLDKRRQQGCSTASQFWRELKQHGYGGQLSSVRNRLQVHRSENAKGACKRLGETSLADFTAAHRIVMFKKPTSAKNYPEEFYVAFPAVVELAHLVREFFHIVRNRGLTA